MRLAVATVGRALRRVAVVRVWRVERARSDRAVRCMANSFWFFLLSKFLFVLNVRLTITDFFNFSRGSTCDRMRKTKIIGHIEVFPSGRFVNQYQ